MAQMPRAILLASAMATSMRGFFAIMRASQEPSGAPFRDTHRTTAMAPMMSSRRISRWLIFQVFLSRCLPPVDLCNQLIDLVQQIAADLANQIRQIGVLVLNETFKSAQITNSLRRDVAELIEVRTQCVDQLGAMIDQLFSRAKHYGPRLLLLGFHFDEAHRWPLRCLDDRLRIRCVVLLWLPPSMQEAFQPDVR